MTETPDETPLSSLPPLPPLPPQSDRPEPDRPDPSDTALLGYPPCESHKEVQHRDAKPPWCDRCGWNRGRPALPARQMSDNPRLGDLP